jgi:hypothetical protein
VWWLVWEEFDVGYVKATNDNSLIRISLPNSPAGVSSKHISRICLYRGYAYIEYAYNEVKLYYSTTLSASHELFTKYIPYPLNVPPSIYHNMHNNPPRSLLHPALQRPRSSPQCRPMVWGCTFRETRQKY